MKILMISLDKKILDVNSRVAERMRQYGQSNELFIIIPAQKQKKIDLSQSVQVMGTGGNKIQQFLRLYFRGKKIIRENKIELITTQDPFFAGLIGVLLKRQFKMKLEIQLHGDFFSGSYYREFKIKLGRWVVHRADRLRVVGERIKKSLIDLGVEKDKIETRPVLIDAGKIKTGETPINLREKYPGYEKIFVWAGRMEPVKNLLFLIDVFGEVVKKYPKVFLLLVGDGSLRQVLEQKMKKENLEKNIKFVGWVHNPLAYLAKADAVLFPSLSEGYGLVAMEAAAAGTPIIMTDVGVANYELRPGPKVVIVPVGDKDAFVNAMLEI